MKILTPATSINRFPFVILSFALLVNTIIIIWLVWHIYGLDDFSTTGGHNHSSWLLVTIVTVILLTLLTWLKTIRNLYSSQKTIVVNNAERMRVEKDLQQSEAHFRDLIENANDLIYTGDLQGNFTSLNKVGEVITGYTQAEFCKMKFADVVAPEHLENARQKFAQKIISHIPTAYELEIITKSGQKIALALSNRVIFKAGEAIGVQGIGRDITDHKLAEKTLRESEARYRVVTESASDAILTIDRESTILFVNSAAEKIFGYTVDEMLGNKLSMLMPEAMRDAQATGMKRFQETNKRQISWRGVEITGLHKDGREVSLEITFGEINSYGKHLFTAVIRDITERKQARKELQSNLSLLTSTFEATADGILVVNRDNKIVTYNQRFIEMWQIPDEIIDSRDNAKTVYHILEQLSNADDFVNTTKHLTQHPEINNLDIVEFKDGKIFERYSHPQMLDGEVIGRVVSFRDITERKRAEEKLNKNERFLRTVLENITDGIVACDAEGNLSLFNKATSEFHGLPQKSLAPEQWAEHYSLYYADATTPMQMKDVPLYRALREGSVEDVELVIKPKNGTTRTVISSGQALFDEHQQKLGAVVVMHDITERKKAGEELQKNLSLLTSTFEATGDGILVINRNNTIVTYNRRYIEMWQIPDEILVSMDYAKVLDYISKQLSNADAFINITKCLTANPEIKNFDILEFKDGRVFERNCHPQIMNGTIVGQVASFRDVTTHKRAEEKLRQSEEKHRTILETIEEGYYETNLTGKFTFFNDALSAYFGYDKDELKGLDYRHYLDEETADHVFRTYNKVFTTGQPVRCIEFEITRKDGTRFFGESSVSLIRNAATEPTGFRGVIRDITTRKQAEDTLRESEALLAAAQRITHLGSWELDLYDLENLNNNELRWSDETYRIFGYEPGQIEVSNEIFYNAVHPDDLTRIGEVLTEAIKQRKDYKIEHRIILPDGNERIVCGQAELIFDKQTDTPLKLLGTIQDITERKGVEEALRDSEYKLRTLVASMREGLTQVSNDEVIEFVNDRLCEMTGYERDELIGKITFDVLFDDEGRELLEAVNRQRRKGISGQYEMRLRKKSGEMLWMLIGGSPIVNADGEMTGTLGVFTDITERKRIEEQLLYDAFHDGLTGLANRALFMDHLRMTIERSKSRHSNPYAVLFLDFDRFKMVNDSLGHAEGDQLLNQIARRLESSTRTGDLVARLGGDEFVILLSEMLAESDAVQVAERIQTDLKKTFDLSGSKMCISASIGIALSNAGHKRAEDMVRDADIAMYRAKTKGKAQYQIFDQAMHEYASRQLQLETEMRQSLERQEFQLHYQPIVSLKTETLIGFEALVRWQHPTRGMIPPFEFIGAAEENGLILPLGNWILQESCRQLRRWQDDNPAASHLTVSVNLSCKQFLQSDLAEQIAATLCETGLDPRCLKLEITESHIMENSEMAVTIMNRLRALGIEISLDDFGTGYSSLSYLHSLPVDYLKVDRSFVTRMTDSTENSEIVFTIIKLAQNLKMKVIAEGIETADQLAHLKNLHCEYGQGYFFSKPLEANAAEKFIEENGGDFPFVIKQDFGIELNM